MIKKHFKENTTSLRKLKFKYRKTIHYALLAAVIFLEVAVVAIWYNENKKEAELSKVYSTFNSMNRISKLTSKVSNSFIDSQKHFNNYIISKDKVSLDKYTTSLTEAKELVNNLSTATQHDKAFKSILIRKKKSEADIIALQSAIDSIITLQSDPNNNQAIKNFKLQKFEFKKTLDSLKTDSYIMVDSVSKKGLFSRLGDAISGKVDIQKEQLNTIVTMKYKDKVTTGSVEDQIKNVLKTTDKYYAGEFNHLKKSFINLRNQDLKLIKLNNELLSLSQEILPNYNNALDTLQGNSQNKLQDQLNSSEKVRNYSIVMLVLLMFIISLILFNFTRLAFEYEKRLTKAQDQIRQSLDFKNKIMGMISHEIRSPLNIISIYSKKVSSSIVDVEIKDTFKSIQFTTNALVHLANQILEYSKDENYQPTLKCANFNLKTEIYQIVSSMSSLVESKGNKIEINSNLNEDCEVYSDATKIHQLFYNIIGNANKFTDNGVIAITINLEDLSDFERNLQIEVHDNGTGISEKDLKRIFESYYQGTTSKKINDLGVGLGLSLCKEIIELFDGEINVQSKEGNGTTVTFNLILSQI